MENIIFCPHSRTEYREGITFCGNCSTSLVNQLLIKGSEASKGPSEYITVLKGADSATLMAAKSLPTDAGIPFIVRGEKPQDLVDPGRIGTNFSLTLGTVKLQATVENTDEARFCIRSSISLKQALYT
jgi:hypothetical protein